MKFIDLSLGIHESMWVYPGDPEVRIEQLQTLENDNWNMQRIHINTHDGTHVNAPIHVDHDGKTLDEYSIEDFCGECVLYETPEDLQPHRGVILRQKIDLDLAKIIVQRRPKFVGVPFECEIDEDVERFLLSHNVILFERLANTEQLPRQFIFHGVPLKIKRGDGSPVRAYATYE